MKKVTIELIVPDNLEVSRVLDSIQDRLGSYIFTKQTDTGEKATYLKIVSQIHTNIQDEHLTLILDYESIY